VIALDTVDGGAVAGTFFGNVDLHNNTGRAWFPDGHAGRLTQIEFLADYSRTVDTPIGAVALTGGLHSYNLPNGTEFQNGERGGTTEIFGRASTEVLGATPYFSYHYDFDEVRGAYYVLGVTEDFPIDDHFTVTLDGGIEYASSAQAAWLYGLNEAGFSALRGSASLAYAYDTRTSIALGLHASTVVDSALDDWFTQLNIDSDVYWATLGVTWSF
jgi:hypothetical protein